MGEIEQIGTPKETYEAPASAYVADFLGVANLLPATVSAPGRVIVNGAEHTADTAGVSGDCTVLIRPERVLLSPLGNGQVEAVPAVVEQRIYVGCRHPGPVASRRAQVAGTDRQRRLADVRRRGRDRRRLPPARRDPSPHVLTCLELCRSRGADRSGSDKVPGRRVSRRRRGCRVARLRRRRGGRACAASPARPTRPQRA